jgi:alpha-L-rhamnosidase
MKNSVSKPGSGWKTYKNPAYEVISYYEMLFRERWFYGFYACGGGDEVFAEKYPWGWETSDFEDFNWIPAEPLVFDKQPPWNLVPRNIAFMDNHLVFPEKIRKVSGVNIPREFGMEKQNFQFRPTQKLRFWSILKFLRWAIPN